MQLKVVLQPKRLLVQTAANLGKIRVSVAERPNAQTLAPIHYSQTGSIRLPSRLAADRILSNPIQHQRIFFRKRTLFVQQKIEIMQVVTPKPIDILRRPIHGTGRKLLVDIQKVELV
jgi:hypothetical protein